MEQTLEQAVAPRFNPLEYPGGLEYPARVAASHWLEHAPFAMALVGMARPRVLVELGTYTGVSYCAFCQAVARLGLACRCYAVDTWRGDPHNGPNGPEVLDDLRAHHDPRYGGFSRLVPGTFDEALAHFPDGCIDLLHVDGYHTYEAARHDFDSWLPKLSGRAVVLLHDTNVREHDFGVWRLWQELQERYPAFEFDHQHGLGLAAVGPDVPRALRPLLEAGEEEAARVRQLYYQLGQRVSARWQAARLQDEHAQRLEAERRAAQAAADQAHAAWDARLQHEQARLLQEQARHAEELVAERQAHARQLAEQQEAHVRGLAARDQELARGLAARDEELARELAARDEELARELAAHREARTQELARQREAHLEELAHQAAESTRRLEMERETAARTLAEHQAEWQDRLAESEQWLQVHRLQLAEKDDVVKSLRGQLAQKDEQVQDLQRQLAQHAAVLQATQAQVAHGEQRLESAHRQLVQQAAEVQLGRLENQRLIAQVQALRGENDDMRRSLALRWGGAAGRWLRRCAPAGSLRRRSLRLGRRSAQVLRREGLVALVRRVLAGLARPFRRVPRPGGHDLHLPARAA